MVNSYRIAARRRRHETPLSDGPEPALPHTPESVLLTLHLRRIVRARLAAHVAAAPELRPAVDVVLYEERPRSVAERHALDVRDLYRASERLRAELRDDDELQRLWVEYADAA